MPTLLWAAQAVARFTKSVLVLVMRQVAESSDLSVGVLRSTVTLWTAALDNSFAHGRCIANRRRVFRSENLGLAGWVAVHAADLLLRDSFQS
jgi:hypothetical protein